MTNKARAFWVVIVLLLFLVAIGLEFSFAYSENNLHMPLVFKDGVYYDTPTPTATLEPTPTKTPKPPEPTPTATPTRTLREGANTCGVALGAGINPFDGGTDVGALVPGLCSFVEFYQEQLGGTVLVVKANGIKIDTWGCMEGDFGSWPPDESDCPPVEPFFDDYGRILWGDIEITHFENSYQKVCFFCDEEDCGNPTNTYNCVEVHRPKTMAELHEIITGE